MLFFRFDQNARYRELCQKLRSLPTVPDYEDAVESAMQKLDIFSPTFRNDLIGWLDGKPELWSTWLEMNGGDCMLAARNLIVLANCATNPADRLRVGPGRNTGDAAGIFAVCLSLAKFHPDAAARISSELGDRITTVNAPLILFMLDCGMEFPFRHRPKSSRIELACSLRGCVRDGELDTRDLAGVISDMLKGKCSETKRKTLAAFALFLEENLHEPVRDEFIISTRIAHALSHPKRTNMLEDTMAALRPVIRAIAGHMDPEDGENFVFMHETFARYREAREILLAMNARHISLVNVLAEDLAKVLPAKGTFAGCGFVPFILPDYRQEWWDLPNADKHRDLPFWEPMTRTALDLVNRLGYECSDAYLMDAEELVKYITSLPDPYEASRMFLYEVWDEIYEQVTGKPNSFIRDVLQTWRLK